MCADAWVCVREQELIVPMRFSYAYRCDQWIHLKVLLMLGSKHRWRRWCTNSLTRWVCCQMYSCVPFLHQHKMHSWVQMMSQRQYKMRIFGRNFNCIDLRLFKWTSHFLHMKKENKIHWRATKAMITVCILLSYWGNNLSIKKQFLALSAGNCREHYVTPSKHLHFPPNFRPLTSHYSGLASHKSHLWQHWGGYRWWPTGLFIPCGAMLS